MGGSAFKGAEIQGSKPCISGDKSEKSCFFGVLEGGKFTKNGGGVGTCKFHKVGGGGGPGIIKIGGGVSKIRGGGWVKVVKFKVWEKSLKVF